MRTSVAVHSFVLMVALQFSGINGDVRLCSYNVPQFNRAKSSNSRIIHTMKKIFVRCDLALLLGVEDGNSVNVLLSALNSKSDRYTPKYKYKSVLSKPLGTDPKHMELYTFIYRTQTMNLTGQHQYQAPGFIRPPFAVRFQSNKTLAQEFVLIPLHSEPSKTVKEMDKLYDVFSEVHRKWSNKNIMLLGDFHAGCAYMNRTDKKKIRIFTNTSFSWLISDKTDTTLTDVTHCPYDRMVVFGKSFLKQIRPFSAKVFNPVQAFKIRTTELVQVSDHFPLEVDLKSSAMSLLHGSHLCFLLLILHFLFLTL